MALERFHEAQFRPSAGFETALSELRAGRKTSHWIWYIFPQIAGLGRSSTAAAFALRDASEAREYLRDPILRSRYEAVAYLALEQLNRGTPVEELMGGSTDALKLASSVTLFRKTAESLAANDPTLASLARCCDRILQQIAPQGYGACAFTLAQLASEPAVT
jgi:uncharacterized protein (DUF1810 family)